MAVVTGSGAATTSPVTYLLVHGVMTNTKVALVHSTRGGGSYVGTDGGSATFGRGTTVIFRLTNEGSQSYLPAIKVLPGPYLPPVVSPADKNKVYNLAAQRVAPPGGKIDFVVTFVYRGSYRMLELLHKHVHGVPVTIKIT